MTLPKDTEPLLTKDESFFSHLKERLFFAIAFIATFLPLIFLCWLITDTLIKGLPRLSIDFLLNMPSRSAEKTGILPSLLGSFYLLLLTASIALPIGIMAAIYLQEYAKESFLKRLIEMNVTNLSGIPSVIVGLLGLELFVRGFKLGPSLLAGALTLSLLILPIIITSSKEALKSVSNTYREAGYALGASRLMVIVKVVLPQAWPQIITGAILSISRALGESAPLIVVGAATYLTFLPTDLSSEFSALPLQIFHWVERPQKGFQAAACAAIIVLLMLLIMFNGLAAWLRRRQEQKRGGS